MNELIAFAGYAGAGKTTAANIVAERYGHSVRSFADPVRGLLNTLDPLVQWGSWPQPVSEWTARGRDYAWLKANTDYRDLLVKLGAGARQHISPDVWVWAMEVRMDGGPVVIDDLRYRNEAEWVLARGGRVIYLYRKGVGPANEEEKRSVAEVAMNLRVEFLPNDDTLAQLEGWLPLMLETDQ